MTSEFRRTNRRIENPGHGRYITFSCYRRLPLFSNDSIKDAMMDRIALVKNAMSFCLYAWVIMPEHVHMVIKTGSPEKTGKDILHRLKWPFARMVIGRWRKLGARVLPRITDATGDPHFWQTGGGYDRNLMSEEEWFEKMIYIHNNPVRRGLVERPIDWRWSSARWYEGDRSGPNIDPLW